MNDTDVQATNTDCKPTLQLQIGLVDHSVDPGTCLIW